MTHFRVFLDPFFDHLFHYPHIQGSMIRVSRKNPKKGSKKWVPEGVSRSGGPPKLDILSSKCQIWHVFWQFLINFWSKNGSKNGSKKGSILWPIFEPFLEQVDLTRQRGFRAKMPKKGSKNWPKNDPKNGQKMAKKWVKKGVHFWTHFWTKNGSKNWTHFLRKLGSKKGHFRILADFWPKTTGSYLCKVWQNHQKST